MDDGEWFVFDGTSYKIDGWQLWSKSQNYTSTVNSLCLIRIIENKDRIIRQPRFTEDEVAVLRAIKASYPWAGYIVRALSGLYFTDLEPGLTEKNHLRPDTIRGCCGLPDKLFPSLLPGQSIAIEDIIHAT